MRQWSSVFVVAVVIISTTSCKKILELKENLFSPIDINLPAFQVSVPVTPIVPPNEVNIGAFTTGFNLDSAIKANTAGVFGVSAISSIRINKMTLTVVNTDEQNNLSNFEAARLAIYSNTVAMPTDIATFSFPDAYTASSTYAPVGSPDLKQYFRGSEITYTLSGKGRRPTSKPLTITVNTSISVK